MAKIAFLGLGQMGAPMATRLLQAGHELTVWNRTPDRAKPLAAAGATVARSPAEAGAGAALAITMLATPEALKDVVLGAEHGLVRALGPGQMYIDMSTVGPHTVRSIAAQFPQGVAVVDAPVRGSVSQAAEGRLEIFVGAGAAMKLVANLVLGASIAAVGEAPALGEPRNVPSLRRAD
jgi:3-hydroxyisobutyrate dehydrogenase-like beta-hydroxyacid dehydrogenase